MVHYLAFTTTYEGLSNKLINEVHLQNGNEIILAKAQWDTGATNSCISHDVVSNLKLIPFGIVNSYTPSGSAKQNTYIININLPNNLNINDVVVTESEIGKQGIDILIGMDVIRHGDFAISNCSGKTVFTFRFPSIKTTDYVEEYNDSVKENEK